MIGRTGGRKCGAGETLDLSKMLCFEQLVLYPLSSAA